VLHPIQQAFVEEHGLQCSFCTPGFVMSVHELLELHRIRRRRFATSGRQPVPVYRLPGDLSLGEARRTQTARAERPGGAGLMPDEIQKTIAGLPTSKARFIGQPTQRIEDPALVSGRVEFIDNAVLPGMLHCAILRSPYPHARIIRIDTSRAEALAGVRAVVAGDDARRWTAPLATIPDGWGVHCLAVGKVRFVGEPVAAVAATSRYLAEDALELIDVEYEPLAPVVDAFAAMTPASPLILERRAPTSSTSGSSSGAKSMRRSATPTTSSRRSSAGTASARTRWRPSA
jgi:hypothetical protein